jgi:hypothetical protein
MFNIASDLQTKQLVWIATSLQTGKQFKHKGEVMTFPATEVSASYQRRYGNLDENAHTTLD